MNRRRTATLVSALLALLLAAPVAVGGVSALANDPLTGFPFAYQDDVAGFAVSLCMDGDANRCVGAPVPHPNDPYMVPDNFTPDGEAFWWRADAVFPAPFDTALAEFAQEAAFANEAIVAGDQVAFSRIRFRIPGLQPGEWYRIQHPYGTAELQANNLGVAASVEDIGCFAPPCNFATAPQGQVTSFLFWDPTVAPAAPAGYIGEPLVEHRVVGSPLGRNSVRVDRISGPGGGVVQAITSTELFAVMGKLAGPPPAPAPFAVIATDPLVFAPRQVDELAPPQSVTIQNRGSAPLQVTGAALSGIDAADFAADATSCAAPLAVGATCQVVVGFQPIATGARTATLSITHSARNSPKSIPLSGTGTPAPALTILSARFARGYSRSRAGGFSLSKFRAKGIDLVLRLQPGTQSIRVRVLRVLPPRKRGGRERLVAIVTDFVTPSPGAAGTSRLRFNPTVLQVAARRGKYRVQLAPARRPPNLGQRLRLDFAIDHR